MRDWLEHTIPFGRFHTWLVDAAESGARILIVIAMFCVLRWLGRRLLRAALRPLVARAEANNGSTGARVRTLGGQAESALTYTLLFLAIVTLVSQLGINIATLLTGAGVAGLAISFGAQRLVRDLLTGFFLLWEDQFRVGEVVTLIGSPGLPQLTGTVQDMGFRTSRLKDITGKIVTIGNGDIAAVVNHSRGPIATHVEIGVSPDVPLDRLREAMAAAQLPPELFSGGAEVKGIAGLEPSRTVFRVAAPAQPGMALDAELALRVAVAEALRKADVEIR